MGPVPEPVPAPCLSDEDRPQHPPIFLSSSDEEDEETDLATQEGYPPGYMPITQHMEIQWDSDFENDSATEEEANHDPSATEASNTTTTDDTSTTTATTTATAAVVAISPAPVATVRQPSAPQGDATSIANDGTSIPDDELDYNSVTSLMQALQTHGPNVVQDACGLEETYADNSGPPDSEEQRRDRRAAAAEARVTETSSSTHDVASDTIAALAPPPSVAAIGAAQPEITESRLLSSGPMAPAQADAVRLAMSSFSLPPSAIPAWAANLQDSDLTAIIKEKIDRPS